MSVAPDSAVVLAQQEVEQALALDATILSLIRRWSPGTGFDGIYQDTVPPPAAPPGHPSRTELYPAIVLADKGTVFKYVYGDLGPTIIGYEMTLGVMAVTTGRSKTVLYPLVARIKQVLHNHRVPGGTIRSMISNGEQGQVEIGDDGNPYSWLGDDWRIIGQLPA